MYVCQREVSEAVRLAVLPPAFNQMPGQAHECALACTALPTDVSVYKVVRVCSKLVAALTIVLSATSSACVCVY